VPAASQVSYVYVQPSPGVPLSRTMACAAPSMITLAMGGGRPVSLRYRMRNTKRSASVPVTGSARASLRELEGPPNRLTPV